jgi:hypothetical protein
MTPEETARAEIDAMHPTRKPRILYLADRNFLVDDPKDKTFSAFGDESGAATHRPPASDGRKPTGPCGFTRRGIVRQDSDNSGPRTR